MIVWASGFFVFATLGAALAWPLPDDLKRLLLASLSLSLAVGFGLIAVLGG